MKVHPALAPFPELAEPELAALALDVRDHGLVNPVVRCEGMLLDGRARLVACERAGVKPRFTDYAGDAVAFVLRANGGRTMTPGQRAMVGARLYAQLRATRQVSPETPGVSGDTCNAAAAVVEQIGVPRATLFRAVRLLADDELARAVERGELRVQVAVRRLAAPASRPKAEKKYWREPLADKLKADIDELEERIRDACKDEIVRSMIARRVEDLVANAYKYADGSAYTSEAP